MGRGQTDTRTLRLYDRIGPVGRFHEKVWGGEPSLKILAPYLFRFGSEGVLKMFEEKDQSLYELMTKFSTDPV